MAAATSAAWQDNAAHIDRIDVIGEDGVRIGWLDPHTGVRTLLFPGRSADFDEMVEFWLNAAGLHDQDQQGGVPGQHPPLGVNEIRYPDADVVRSLLIPVLQLH